MKTTKKRLYFIFGLCSAALICPTIFYSVAKAQESNCLTVDPSGQVTIVNGSCNPSSQGQESESMAKAEEFFQRARDLDKSRSVPRGAH